MNFIWNSSLKHIQVQILPPKNAQKRVQNELEKKTEPSTKECQVLIGTDFKPSPKNFSSSLNLSDSFFLGTKLDLICIC